MEIETNAGFKSEWKKEDGIEYLYHFTSVDSLIKILLTDKFRLSSVNYMNDINESLPLYESFKRSEEEIEEEKENRKRTFLGCFNVLKEEETIRDKSSLWGYYAQGCTGVCIKVNKSKFDDLVFDIIYDIDNEAIEANINIEKFKVKYENESNIHRHREICARGTTMPFYIELKYLFNKKSSEWKIENEFRYLVYNDAFEDKEYFYIEKFSKVIEAVYIGKNNKDLELIKDLKFKLAKNIKFYIMNKQREELEL